MSPAAPEGAPASDPTYEEVCVASRTVGSTVGNANGGPSSTGAVDGAEVRASEVWFICSVRVAVCLFLVDAVVGVEVVPGVVEPFNAVGAVPVTG